MNGILLDLALSGRIELSEAGAAAGCAEVLHKMKPHSGAAVKQVAGGYAVYCGAGSPVTQAAGIGLNGQVTKEEFDGLEAFYRERNEPVRVETSPLADETLMAEFGKRGYKVTEFTNVMALPIAEMKAEATREDTGAIEVGIAAPGEIDLWARTLSEGFAEEQPVTPELLEIMTLFARREGTQCYLARVKGAVAGGATLAQRDGIAGLFGASTLPAFRKHGVHTALLRARLARAVETGCDLAVCLARPGSTSQRNMTRRGFQTLYTRVKFEREWGRDRQRRKTGSG